jgi:hypothetical protein
MLFQHPACANNEFIGQRVAMRRKIIVSWPCDGGAQQPSFGKKLDKKGERLGKVAHLRRNPLRLI